MKIVIAVPTHNESLVIEQNLRELVAYCEKNLSTADWKIVVGDNGSSDDTVAKVARIAHPRLVWFHLDAPGKGAAIKKAWTDYAADRYVFMDADLATGLHALPRLLGELEHADLVVGSRFHPQSKVSRSLKRRVISIGFSWLARMVIGMPLPDTKCGFKGMRREAAEQILPTVRHLGFFFDTELIALALKQGLRVRDIPVIWQEQRVLGRTTRVPIGKTFWNDMISLFALRRRLRNRPLA